MLQVSAYVASPTALRARELVGRAGGLTENLLRLPTLAASFATHKLARVAL